MNKNNKYKFIVDQYVNDTYTNIENEIKELNKHSNKKTTKTVDNTVDKIGNKTVDKIGNKTVDKIGNKTVDKIDAEIIKKNANKTETTDNKTEAIDNKTEATDNKTDKIILIQKIIRGYLVRKHELIPKSFYQTKQWRKNQKWYHGGRSNECEKQQINIIQKILKCQIIKTSMRLNAETLEFKNVLKPFTRNDGYEWTENFDGYYKNDIEYYFNLKFVCDEGGSQTRTLKEVYHFIKTQAKYLLKNPGNIKFINILDGDNCFNNMDKFNYILEKNKEIKQNIFIGDLHSFQLFWKKSKF